MKDRLIEDIENRLNSEVSSQNPLSYLHDFEVVDYIDEAISSIFIHTRTKGDRTTYMVELIANMGHKIRRKLTQPLNSALAAKTGAFILYSFQNLGVIEIVLGQGRRRHATYIVKVSREDILSALWNTVTLEHSEKLPSETPYAPWVGFKHTTENIPLIKTTNKNVLRKLNPEGYPILFNVLNKSQKVGWRINEDIFKIQQWALRNKADAFNDIWTQTNQQARETKFREATTILDVANRFLGKSFYHLYNFDFRGRKYVSTAFLHEQGSDTARGLLLRNDAKPIGKDGFFWLLVSIASNWAGESGRDDGLKTDKIPLMDRYLWALDNEEILLSYAESPKVNQGWMVAEKPWQFLAACYELKHFRKWQEENRGSFDYYSHLEAYIDGSTNGAQHLAALTRDEVSAKHVNLVQSELPGDLYKYVGEHVWGRLKETLDTYSREEIRDCEAFIDTLIDMKKVLYSTQRKSELHEELKEAIRGLKRENNVLMIIAAPVFWSRIQDIKSIRKIVKR
jgi:hypothetical protein